MQSIASTESPPAAANSLPPPGHVDHLPVWEEAQHQVEAKAVTHRIRAQDQLYVPSFTHPVDD